MLSRRCKEADMCGERSSHFRQAFNIARAIDLIVETSFRVGVHIHVDKVVRSLCEAFPDARRAPEVVEHAVMIAASQAGVRTSAADLDTLSPQPRDTQRA